MKLSILVAAFVGAKAAEWAVIMAGSNTYPNYRHHSDAFHAYQIAKKHGIPESNIILLAYDDVANDSKNPFPGKMYNKPSNPGPAVDVYAGVKIAYKGKDVNAANFIKVLSGDKSATGPVLESTKDDSVFVYYTDHGGAGILGVPNGVEGGSIHAADINHALETLHQNGGYKKLVFYLEACESGSIFAKLLKAPNVFATTAASPTQSSFGWYCPPNDMVNGKHINSCLGDEYSIHWLEDADAAAWASETIGNQMNNVKKETTKSQVQFYGDTAIEQDKISEFEGPNAVNNTAWRAVAAGGTNGAVESRDVALYLAYWNVKRATTSEAMKAAMAELRAEKATREKADILFTAIAIAAVGEAISAQMLTGAITVLKDVNCHQQALKSAVQHCGGFNDYSMKYSRLFVNLCDKARSQIQPSRRPWRRSATTRSWSETVRSWA